MTARAFQKLDYPRLGKFGRAMAEILHGQGLSPSGAIRPQNSAQLVKQKKPNQKWPGRVIQPQSALVAFQLY
jgi:hypothetical protein